MLNRLEISKKVEEYRETHKEAEKLSDTQIISILSDEGKIKLTEDQKNSIFLKGTNNQNNDGLVVQKSSKAQTIKLKSGRKIVIQNGTTTYYAANNIELNKEYFEKHEGQIDIKPSGRYSVTKGGKTKYFAADGTELKESYFKQVESTDKKVKSIDGKTYNFNKTLENRINNVSINLQKAEKSNGFIGSSWNGFKNLTGIGDSSDEVREQQKSEKKLFQQFNNNVKRRPEIFKELTGADYTPGNIEKFIKGEIKLKSEIALQGYNEGQDMAVDIGADIVSGIAAVGIYTASVAAAPFSGGTSIAVGVAAAGASAAAIKTSLKAADAVSGGRQYTLKDAGHDAATGAFSGVLAPITGGFRGAVGKTVATKLGVQAVKQVGKEMAEETAKGGVKQAVKTALTNPAGYEYAGGNIAKRALASGAEMAADGAVGGAVDNAFRTAYDGGSAEEVLNSALEGFAGGAIMSPIIGGGFKAAGKTGEKLFEKANVHIDPNGRKLEYVRPFKVTKEQLINNTKLKDYPECKYLVDRIDTLNKKDKNLNAIFLEMFLSNSALSTNKSLKEALSRENFYIYSDNSLKFLQDFINYPELHSNKYISESLADIARYYNYKNCIKQVEGYIEKFIQKDMTVIDDILSDNIHFFNYYNEIPKSFINKEIEDLTPEEIDKLIEVFLGHSFAPPRQKFLKGIFPAVPTSDNEFLSFANRIVKLSHSNESLINTNKLDNVDNIVSILPGTKVSKESIENLKQIRQSKLYKNLSDYDKQILSIATLLQDVDISPKRLVDILQNSGFSKVDSEKTINVLKAANLVADFMKTNKNQVEYLEPLNSKITTNQRKEFFDNVAFILKEDNTFQLAKILYSSKEIDDFTRYLDKMLEKRIKEIKSEDFMLPQTSPAEYHKKAKTITIKKERSGKEYKVRIVKRSEIPNFHAYVHTPENVALQKDASILQNTAKFILASNDNLSKRVLCACYVDGTSKSFVNKRFWEGYGSGFILQVPNNKQYVGAGSDMESTAKDRNHLLSVYYNKNDLINHGQSVPKGTKTSDLKGIISYNIKNILNISDDEYIKRMDKIKNTLGDEILSLERMSVIDSEMADAYKQFLERRIEKDADFNSAILRDDYAWNEILISEPKIADIYTTHLDRLPDELLELAANPENDFIIVLMYE